MAPSTEFPGNLFYALTFFGFLAFFMMAGSIIAGCGGMVTGGWPGFGLGVRDTRGASA